MIVITTPTGQVVDKILDNGDELVWVIARDPSRLDPHAHERVEVVDESHDDIDVVTAAFAGADRVFWVVPPNPRAKDVFDYDTGFTRPAYDVFVAHGQRSCDARASRGDVVHAEAGIHSRTRRRDRRAVRGHERGDPKGHRRADATIPDAGSGEFALLSRNSHSNNDAKGANDERPDGRSDRRKRWSGSTRPGADDDPL